MVDEAVILKVKVKDIKIKIKSPTFVRFELVNIPQVTVIINEYMINDNNN